MDRNELLRSLPKMDALLEHPLVAAMREQFDQRFILAETRRAVECERTALIAGTKDTPATVDALAQRVKRLLQARLAPYHYRVINATGLVLNTALGRAPLAPSVVEHITQGIRGYCRLAAHPETGKRYDRDMLVGRMMAEIFGCEAATFVNNNAAATYLVLSALTAGKEVIVSRGQLVEIGGKFRIPDVMAASGATLVEVGTTNRTHMKDYEKAITDRTGAILRVHTSNYRISGFSSMPGIEELAPLAHEKGLLCIDDIGSGQLVDMAPLGLPNDYPLRDSIAAGADIVCFSGDKLMGGVQSGIIAGRETAIGKIRNHPLARAFRCGKMTVLGLEAALKLYYNTDRARREVPTLALLGKPASELKRTADRIRRGIKPPCTARVAAGKTFVGGGSLPDTELDSWTVRLVCEGVSAEDLARALRTGRPSVHSRVEENEVVLDVRTLLSGEDRELIAAVNSVKA